MPWKTNKNLKRTAIALLAILITLAVLVAVMPYGIKWGVTAWLEEQGIQAKIERIRLKLIDGVVQINAAQGKNSAGDGFDIGEARLHFAWRPLWDKQFAITQISIHRFRLDIVEDSSGVLSVGGLQLPATVNEPQSQTIPPSPEDHPWRILLGEVEFADIQLCHRILRQHPGINQAEPKATQATATPTRLKADELKDKVLHQNACLQLEEMHWQGEVLYPANKAEIPRQDIPLQAIGELEIKQLDIDDLKHQREYLAFESLRLEQLQLAGLQNIGIQKLRLQEVHALVEDTNPEAQPNDNKIVTLKELFISPININSLTDIQIGLLNFVGPDVLVQRGEAGGWRIKDWLPEKQPTTTTTDKQPSQPLQLKIKELNFTENGHAVFHDASLDPPFRIEAQTINIKVLDIDNTQPDKKSQATVDLIIGKHGAIHLEGYTVVFAKRPTFDLTGSVKGLDLRPTTSYTIRYLGHRIKHGQLDMDLKLKADNGILDSVLKMEIHKFELEALSPEDQKELDNNMGVPVNTALVLLRDKDDAIRLELPITGDINNPDFDPTDAITQAISKSLTTAVINYYTPFGLVTATGMMLDLATALRFDPVVFNPGKHELAASHYEYLDKLAKLMKERPGVYLILCGRVNSADLQALFPTRKVPQQSQAPAANDSAQPALKLTPQEQQALLRLATQRADGIKDYLVRAGEVAHERLIVCDPLLELQAENISGVEISI